MKAQIREEEVNVYAEAIETSNILSELHADDEIDMGKSIKNGDSTWLKVTTPDGKIGFISGETLVFKIRDVRLDQVSICVLNSPDANSKTDTILKEGDKFTITHVLTEGGNTFLKIRLNSGETRFLPGNTMIKDSLEVSSQVYTKRIGYLGAGVAALLVTILFPSHESSPIAAAKYGWETGTIAGVGGGLVASLLAHLFFKIFRRQN